MGCSLSVEDQENSSCTVCFLGLDSSGKSHIVHKLVSTDGSEYVPISTAGAEFYDIPSSSLRIFDVGGLGKYRDMWPSFIRQSDGVVFVIDKSDHGRLSRVREEIKEVLTECSRLSIPILILANKSDKEKQLKEEDIRSITQVADFHVDYTIKETCALTGEGITSGRDWMLQHMKPRTQKVVHQTI